VHQLPNIIFNHLPVLCTLPSQELTAVAPTATAAKKQLCSEHPVDSSDEQPDGKRACLSYPTAIAADTAASVSADDLSAMRDSPFNSMCVEPPSPTTAGATAAGAFNTSLSAIHSPMSDSDSLHLDDALASPDALLQSEVLLPGFTDNREAASLAVGDTGFDWHSTTASTSSNTAAAASASAAAAIASAAADTKQRADSEDMGVAESKGQPPEHVSNGHADVSRAPRQLAATTTCRALAIVTSTTAAEAAAQEAGLISLCELGFEPEAAQSALRAFKDVTRAADWLFRKANGDVPEGDTPLDDVLPDLMSLNSGAANSNAADLGDIAKLWCDDQDGSMKGLPGDDPGDDDFLGRVTDQDLLDVDFSGMPTDYGECYTVRSMYC
jgi:UBA/TS-N domain